jgi:thiosulfate dehydrogenase (quinone) large subunit
MDGVAAQVDRGVVPVRVVIGGFAALRIFFGLVWLSNGLAKIFLNQNNSLDWGFISFNLVNQPAARGILDGASKGTWQPLRWLYQDFVLANWDFFAWFLTVAELATGLSLLLGIAARLGATVGLLLVGPIWIMLWHTNLYLWEYPNELFPVLLLAIVPAGRVFGQDRKLAPRFGGHWPF